MKYNFNHKDMNREETLECLKHHYFFYTPEQYASFMVDDLVEIRKYCNRGPDFVIPFDEGSSIIAYDADSALQAAEKLAALRSLENQKLPKKG